MRPASAVLGPEEALEGYLISCPLLYLEGTLCPSEKFSNFTIFFFPKEEVKVKPRRPVYCQIPDKAGLSVPDPLHICFRPWPQG